MVVITFMENGCRLVIWFEVFLYIHLLVLQNSTKIKTSFHELLNLVWLDLIDWILFSKMTVIHLSLPECWNCIVYGFLGIFVFLSKLKKWTTLWGLYSAILVSPQFLKELLLSDFHVEDALETYISTNSGGEIRFLISGDMWEL